MSTTATSGVTGRGSKRHPGTRRSFRRPVLAAAVATIMVLTVACGWGDETTASESQDTLTISAIPDQDPEKLQRIYGGLADYLSGQLSVNVEYEPVTDYTAALNLFRRGDLQLVWFGGLTGVQAAIQTPGAAPIVQRDIDAEFQSVFIVNTSTELQPTTDVADLAKLEGFRFTFGSESSTSGRLMPQYFLNQAGLDVDEDFDGPVGFSGSHDATIVLVQSGSYQAGVLNQQVWEQNVADGLVDTAAVRVFLVSPPYHDYHWVARPELDETFGHGFTDEVAAALERLDPSEPSEAAILDLFGATRFVPTEAANYREIEQIGRSIGLITS